MPILAKSMMKIVMTITETKPPVVELYYVYPLYLRSCEVGNRSSILSALLTLVKMGIFYKIFKNYQ